jgi:amidase
LDLDYSTINPVTGPIYVKGAMPGDILSVTLLDIRPRGIGVACCGPDSGQLCHWIPKNTTKFFDLTDDGTIVTMRDSLVNNGSRDGRGCGPFPRIGPIAFPASPMLGVIGVAPAGNNPIPTMPAGKHGGNMDNRCNTIGSTIYIPVNHPGALLSMGDMHASQGDGEISGNGVEIGGHVLLKCDILKPQDLYPSGASSSDCNPPPVRLELEYPVTETKTHWITHGVVVENIPQTTAVACEEAAKILMGQWGFTPEEAFIFLSVQGDLGVCQSCHPDTGTQIAKMTVPKLSVCPRPFRTLQKTFMVDK